MRDSGDLGYINREGKLFYIGRSDQQIKRSGIRMNLNHIQLVCVHLNHVCMHCRYNIHVSFKFV